jgi:hypothetical protein
MMVQQNKQCTYKPFKENTDPSSAWFFLNLALLIGLGVSVLYWIGCHTELLGVVGGLLGLGGAFAWVAFLLNIVREERKKESQIWFDHVMTSKVTTCILLAMALVLSGIGGMFGSVRIDSSREATDRFIEIRDKLSSNKEIIKSGLLPARSTRGLKPSGTKSYSKKKQLHLSTLDPTATA